MTPVGVELGLETVVVKSTVVVEGVGEKDVVERDDVAGKDEEEPVETVSEDAGGDEPLADEEPRRRMGQRAACVCRGW